MVAQGKLRHRRSGLELFRGAVNCGENVRCARHDVKRRLSVGRVFAIFGASTRFFLNVETVFVRFMKTLCQLWRLP